MFSLRANRVSYAICACVILFNVTAQDSFSQDSTLVSLADSIFAEPEVDWVPADYENSFGMRFIWIEPGTFVLGDSDGGYNERPEQVVHITKGFWMGQFEVTMSEWREIMGTLPSSYYEAMHPVRHVSWYDVQDYIVALNIREACECYRLPTEAEWEYVARAGTDNRFFSNPDSIAWYRDNAEDEVHNVGQKAPNAWGIYDMYGNVWEWTADWYELYTEGEKTDPTGPVEGWRKSRRGGSFSAVDTYLGQYFRSRFPPEEQPHDTGFRVVRIVEEE